MNSTLTERVRAANAAMKAIGYYVPKLLYSPSNDRYGRLGPDYVGQIWYVDAFTGMKLYPFGEQPWIGFSEGPKAKILVEALAQYARKGIHASMSLVEDAIHEVGADLSEDLLDALLANPAISQPA